MIKVRKYGRLGNNIAQYCTGRILAERYGLKMNTFRIHGFPKTYENIDGGAYSRPVIRIRRNVVDLDAIDKFMQESNNKAFVYVFGTFCCYPFLKNFKEDIRSWCKLSRVTDNDLKFATKKFKNNDLVDFDFGSIQNDDLLVHVRLGDLLDTKERKQIRSLTYEGYFGSLLNSIKFNRLFIISDSIKSPYMKSFLPFDPILVVDTSPVHDYRLFSSFNKIAMSKSSFSWWGSWMSDAEEIYFPITEIGSWSPNNMKTDAKPIIEESRFKYYRPKTNEMMNYKEANRLFIKTEKKL